MPADPRPDGESRLHPLFRAILAPFMPPPSRCVVCGEEAEIADEMAEERVRNDAPLFAGANT